ncbi:hypothetical protein B0T13DRAFT_156492 [Neurospora crassa]|nr:hypothetical protein B0T13DRAFT_156492 [Neurospora crassa]
MDFHASLIREAQGLVRFAACSACMNVQRTQAHLFKPGVEVNRLTNCLHSQFQSLKYIKRPSGEGGLIGNQKPETATKGAALVKTPSAPLVARYGRVDHVYRQIKIPDLGLPWNQPNFFVQVNIGKLRTPSMVRILARGMVWLPPFSLMKHL